MSDRDPVSIPPLEHVDQPVRCIVDNVARLAEQPEISLGDVVEAFGSDSFLPVMMVPALLVLSPLSGIPTFSTICGLAIAFVAAQMLLGRDCLWLPGWLMRRAVSGARAQKVLHRLRSVADWLDGHSKPRLRLMMRAPGRKAIQALCLLAGLTMPVLEFVPFSSSLLGAAVTFFATALLIRDGLFALAGLVAMGAGYALPLTVVSAV